MPLFNLFGLSSHKRQVKMISSYFSGIMQHVAPERDIYDKTPFLKLLLGVVSFRKQCGWVLCRLGFLGILSYKYEANPP